MCRIESRELRFSRAMVFAIEEINNSTELLPGIKLGYQIHDSCASVPLTMLVAFQLSNGLEPVFYTGNNCSQSGVVMAIVGESGSTPSISMARIIGSFNIPQVNILIFWQSLCVKCGLMLIFYVCTVNQLHCCTALGEPLCHLCMPV